MALTQLPRERWKAFFDGASKAVGNQATTVELTGLGLGDQIAADRVALMGITYEQRDDTLTIFLQGLEHRIHQPKAIHIDHDEGMLNSFEVVGTDDVHHIVQFDRGLQMPKD